MAASQVVAAQQSSLVANLTPLTAGNTAAITNVSLLPRFGSAQRMAVSMVLDAGTADEQTLELELIYRDEALEEADVFGKPRRQRREV